MLDFFWNKKKIYDNLDFSILKTMCGIHAPSGSEYLMTEFILNYIQKEKKNWKNR